MLLIGFRGEDEYAEVLLMIASKRCAMMKTLSIDMVGLIKK